MASHQPHEKNPENVARGYKAALHNPNVSEEAKQRAAQQLRDMGFSDPHEKNPDNIARGYKAALHNANVSAEAKEHAAQQLREMGYSAGTRRRSSASSHHKADKPVLNVEEKSDAHVIGGYKAALHNPHVSEEAKHHAEEVLKAHGAI